MAELFGPVLRESRKDGEGGDLSGKWAGTASPPPKVLVEVRSSSHETQLLQVTGLSRLRGIPLAVVLAALTSRP
jgi:hypothetical protein